MSDFSEQQGQPVPDYGEQARDASDHEALVQIAVASTLHVTEAMRLHRAEKDAHDVTKAEYGELAVRVAMLEAENEELRAAAAVDKLTGLGSPVALDKRLELLQASMVQDRNLPEGERRRGGGLRFTVLYLDYDGFKSINEEVGHDTADQLMRIIGPRIMAALRGDDEAYRRYQGDEKIILLPGQTVRNADDMQRLRDRFDEIGKAAFEEFVVWLEQSGCSADAARLREFALYGYSVGVVSYSRRRHFTAEQILTEADLDMKRDKRERRVRQDLDPGTREVRRDVT